MSNKGLDYERDIRNLLRRKKLLTGELEGKLIPTQNDAGFVHQDNEYFLEVKNETAPDYGAKKIIYDPKRNKWKWNERDDLTDFFDKVNGIGVLKQIPTFTPRKYVKDDKKLTDRDKRFDSNNFKLKIDLGVAGASILHKYYAKKKCYYIQIQGKGLYYLLKDPGNLRQLGVPQFMPPVVLRLRAKPHSSTPIHNYSFRMVITASHRTIFNSKFDFENPDDIKKLLK